MSCQVTSGMGQTRYIEEMVEEEEDDEDVEIELVVQGRTINVSEKLLCEHSVYFRKIFLDFDENQETIILKHSRGIGGEDIPEEKQQEPLALINFTTMVTIVEFLYTNKLAINDQNVKQLLYASDLLSMGSVEAECFTYLRSQLSVRNCIRSYLLATAKRSWKSLADYILRFIAVHFDQLSRSLGVFKLLTAAQFKAVLASPHLNTRYEEQVYDAVIDYVLVDTEARKKHLASLFEEIQWPFIRTPKYYLDTLNDPFVMDDPRCAIITEQAYAYFKLPYQEKVAYWKERVRPSRWPKLLAALSYAEKLIEVYDFEEEEWSVLTEKPGHVFGTPMCFLQGKLYTLGGVQSKTVDQYDVETDTWANFFPSLRHCRVAHGVATDGNRIFVTGGSAKANSNFGPGLSEMEMCEVVEGKKPEWQLVGEMGEGRSFLGSVVLDSKVYQIGGCLSEEKSTTEVWDPDTRKFSAIPRSLSKRDSQGQAVVNDEIYVIGGFDNISNRYLSTVEKYNPERGRWSKLSGLSLPRRSPGVVAYRDRLYVVGGMGEKEDLSTGEVFCPSSNEWSKMSKPMTEVNGWCSACLVDKPIRMMLDEREVTRCGTGLEDWESEGSEDSRRASIASSSNGQAQTDAEKARSNYNWDSAENARTEQRMKKMKEKLKQ